jgi:hypothetical protein
MPIRIGDLTFPGYLCMDLQVDLVSLSLNLTKSGGEIKIVIVLWVMAMAKQFYFLMAWLIFIFDSTFKDNRSAVCMMEGVEANLLTLPEASTFEAPCIP